MPAGGPQVIGSDDNRFAGVAVDGDGREFHVVNVAGGSYRYAIKRMPDGAIVFNIPGDKHSGADCAIAPDGALCVSAAILDPGSNKYKINRFWIYGVATPPAAGGGGGGGGGSGGGGGTEAVDQTARNMASAAQATANQAQSTANSAKSTADSANSTAKSAKSAADAASAAAHNAQATADTAIRDMPNVAWSQAMNAIYHTTMNPEGKATDAGKGVATVAWDQSMNVVFYLSDTPEGQQTDAGQALIALIDERIALATRPAPVRERIIADPDERDRGGAEPPP